MNTRMKRVLAGLLTVLMLVQSMPMGVLAEGAAGLTQSTSNEIEGKKYYSVAFQLEDGTLLDTRLLEKNTNMPEDAFPQPPEKRGYRFEGWVDQQTGKALQVNTRVNRDMQVAPSFVMERFQQTIRANAGATRAMMASAAADAVTLSGMLPDGAQASAVPADANVGEDRLLLAYDITLADADGTAIQPADGSPLTVSLRSPALSGVEKVNIYHEGSLMLRDVPVHGGSVSFLAASFSVFAVAEDGETPEPNEEAIHTYNLYDGEGNLFRTLLLKEGDPRHDPGIPALAGNQEFHGWYREDDFSGTPFEFSGNEGAVPENETINLYAKITTTYYVTFIGAGGEIIAVHYVIKDGADNPTLNTAEVAAVPHQDTQVFLGWRLDTTSEELIVDPLEVTGNMTVFPLIKNAYWITFNENDGGTATASYIGPKAVLDGHFPSDSMPDDPTRTGYTFGGWYTDPECTTAFDWDQELIENTTVYAKWDPNPQTKYTVVVWMQNVGDHKDATDQEKTYDFLKSVTYTAATGAEVTRFFYRTEANETHSHFTYNPAQLKIIDGHGNITTTVGPMGDTVINLYFDRDTIALSFYINTGEDLYLSMEGLYGQTLTRYGYQWPSEYMWFTETLGSGTRITFLDSFLDNQALFRYGTDTGTYYIYHYKQDLNDQYLLANSVRVPSLDWGHVRTFYFSNKYQGFDVKWYRLETSRRWVEVGDSVVYRNENLYVRHVRKQYPLTFINKHPIDGTLSDTTVNDIYYEAPLS